jgi:uncharacterized protein
MPRPLKERRICCSPTAYYFKPAGIPMRILQEVEISWDELEAIRLADLLGLYHDEAAEQMKVSRPTFGRILKSGREKIADSIINGKAIHIPEIMPDNITNTIKNSEPCGHTKDKSNCPHCSDKEN